MHISRVTYIESHAKVIEYDPGPTIHGAYASALVGLVFT